MALVSSALKVMEYIDVTWEHDFADEPIRLVSELGEGRYETRKLEFFRDGTVGFAGAGRSTNSTELGTEPVPSLDSINGQSEFEGEVISEQVFEALWSKYVS